MLKPRFRRQGCCDLTEIYSLVKCRGMYAVHLRTGLSVIRIVALNRSSALVAHFAAMGKCARVMSTMNQFVPRRISRWDCKRKLRDCTTQRLKKTKGSFSGTRAVVYWLQYLNTFINSRGQEWVLNKLNKGAKKKFLLLFKWNHVAIISKKVSFANVSGLKDGTLKQLWNKANNLFITTLVLVTQKSRLTLHKYIYMNFGGATS